MEVDAQAQILGRVPHGVPVRVGQHRRIAEEVRLLREQHALVAELEAAIDLRDRLVHVPEGDGHDRQQPLRIDGGPLVQEVVVGADAGEHELGVLKLEEVLIPEARHVRVDDVGVHPVLVHALQALRRVVGAGVEVLEGRRVGRRPLAPAGHRRDADRRRGLSVEDPDVTRHLRVRARIPVPRRLPGDVANVGHHVAPLLRRDTRCEEVVRLRHVRVDIDDLDLVGDHACLQREAMTGRAARLAA